MTSDEDWFEDHIEDPVRLWELSLTELRDYFTDDTGLRMLKSCGHSADRIIEEIERRTQ